MSKLSTINMQVSVSGDGVATSNTPPSFPLQNQNAPAGGPVDTVLSSGDNTLTPPPSARNCLIVPLQSSSVVKKLKGVNGDTGVIISPNTPTLLGLTAAPAAFILNAASGETVSIQWL